MEKSSFNKKWNFAVKNKNSANSRLDFLRKKNETTNYGMNRNSKSTLRKKVCKVPSIIQLQKWKGEEPKVLQGAEDYNETSDEFLELREDSKNIKSNQTNEISKKKKSRLSLDFAKIFLIIGNLEKPIKNNNNLFSQTKKETSPKNATILKSISTNFNSQMEKNDFFQKKNKLTYVNHINVNIMNDTSRNQVQILASNETTGEKILNPHLGREKSYFLYKNTT